MTAVPFLELARRQEAEALVAQAQQRRTGPGWDAASALELACAWLLLGDRRQADLAFLEADQLDRSLALVPDPWGLWPLPPEPGPADPASRQQLQALAERYRAWRLPDAQGLWQQLLPQLQADWKQALEPACGDTLRLLGLVSGLPGAAPLDPPLEDGLAPLVGDTEIAAEPAGANRFWQLLASLRPAWALARIRAADLALARGELEASGRWLSDPPDAALTNPWFHDVAARHAVAQGRIEPALDAWAEAIRIAEADANLASLPELFQQRRREARRGPGVLQVRSLANRGDAAAALALLERLLAEDPQWQPLRSLREQLQGPTSAAPAAAAADGYGAAVAVAAPPDGASEPGSFSALLDRAAARLEALGHPLPQPLAPDPSSDTLDAAACAAALQAWSRQLSDFEARFALA